MNINENRIEFLNALTKIRNHMNWCKIKLKPKDKEEIDDERIMYDYTIWEAEDDSILDELKKTENIGNCNLIDIILKIHYLICEHFVFDDFCYFLGKYDKEKNICLIDEKYGRNPNERWREERRKHNRRICYDLSRYAACRIKQFANEECDIFLVTDEYETHYATAVISKDFMITIDADDFFMGEDLNRIKFGLKIKGITIVSDEKNIVKAALEKINLNRKSKKDFEAEAKEDSEKKEKIEWLEMLLNQIRLIGDDGVFKYMDLILKLKGYEPKKIWQKYEERYIETLYFNWDMGYIVINSQGIDILPSRDFFDRIQEGQYLPNKNRRPIAEEIEYNG